MRIIGAFLEITRTPLKSYPTVVTLVEDKVVLSVSYLSDGLRVPATERRDPASGMAASVITALNCGVRLRPVLPAPQCALPAPFVNSQPRHCRVQGLRAGIVQQRRNRFVRRTVVASLPALDLTEENICQVLVDARTELAQIFDTSVGMTGVVELAELDGPYVKLRLSGRFWHTRATVVARVGNYLKNRIPEILEVEIEDEKQLDDSPENF